MKLSDLLICLGLGALWVTGALATNENISVTESQRQRLGIVLQSPLSVQSIPLGVVPGVLTVPPENDHLISAPLAGLVERVEVARGDSVGQGQVLVTLDSPELLLHQQHLIDAWNEWTVARARYEREKKLFQAGIIARKRWLETEKTWRQARTAFDQARRELIVMGFKPGEIDRLRMSARLDSHVVLRAPATGVVTEHRVSVGQRVGRADTLMKVTAVHPLWLEMAVPTHLADRLELGAGVKVEGWEARGEVILASSVVDPLTQTVLVRAELTRAGGLQPGRKVTVRLSAPVSGVLRLPRSALLEHQGKSYVFVRADGGFEVRPVTVAAMTDDAVFVEKGVRLRDSVAVKGVASLKAAWLGVGEDE